MEGREKYDVTLKDYDGNVETTVSVSQIARCLTHEQFVYLFDNFLNYGGKEYREGKRVGSDLRSTHRTLQRLAIGFALGLIEGISEQEYTDARNETAIETAKKIAGMMEKGELPIGWMI